MTVDVRHLSALRTKVRPDCMGCGGQKGAPLAGMVSIWREDSGVGITIALCEECGRDAANAIGFMCVRDGGWSKLEPRKKKPRLSKQPSKQPPKKQLPRSAR